MTPTGEFKLLYNDLYEQMRTYMWDLDVIYALVDVEIESYKAFPDMKVLEKAVSNLRYIISGYDIDDEELFAALDAYEEYYCETDDLYEKIERFREVIDHEDHEDSDDEEQSD